MSEVKGWTSVAEETPSPGDWVFVWSQGRIALAKYAPQFPVRGMFDWLILPAGSPAFAPFPQHYPKYWRGLLLPPPGSAWDSGLDDDPGVLIGESLVRWRGSVGDLYTDLKSLLSVRQMEELRLSIRPSGAIELHCNECGLNDGAHYDRCSRRPTGAVQDIPNTSLLPKPPAPSPVPMLLWCPECSERHIDRGEFATKVHHTHACQFCGHVWRPAIVPTCGVQFLPGFKSDGPSAVPSSRESRGYCATFVGPIGESSAPGFNGGLPPEWAWPSSPSAMCARCLRICSKAEDHSADCPERTF